MKESNTGCNRIVEIDLRHAQGLEVSKSDEDFRQTHLITCPDCSREASALAAIGMGDNPGALPELDDLKRRRIIGDVIAAAAEQSSESVSGYDARSKTSLPARFYKHAWVGTLAAACILAVVAWRSWPEPESLNISDTQLVDALSPSKMQPLEGHFMLLYGDVKLQSHDAVLGDRLQSDDTVRTEEGRAVIALPTGIVISLAENTEASLRSVSTTDYEVSLEKGWMQVSMEPNLDRAGFCVVTRDGNVKVVGTVFSVEVKESVQVRVLRGEVKLEEQGDRQRRLRTNGATTLGTAKTWTLSKNEREALWKEARAVELLDATGNTLIDIESVPTGASVVVDSVNLGRTPVSASVKPGYRELTLSVAGRSSIRELVDIEAGSHLSREFNLSPVKANTPRTQSPRPVARESASELLLNAQRRRAQGDWSGAAEYYERLVSLHPESGEAEAGLISLCDIQLRKIGQTQKALRCFNQYLDRSVEGPLVQEAMFGKAVALKQLGNSTAERQVLDRFLSLFPEAIQAQAARKRVEELQQESQ